jgi:hypothetical protein
MVLKSNIWGSRMRGSNDMKIRTSFRHIAFALSAMLVAVLAFSCSGDKSTDAGDDIGLSPSNPDSLLKFFATSYAEKDLDRYDQSLDESFRFVFTDDIADSLDLPRYDPWWGKTEDMSSTRMMFEDPSVEGITFTYEAVGEWVDTTVVIPDTTFSGFFRRIDPFITFVRVTGDLEDPELLFRVDGTWLGFVVVPDRFTEGLWCVLQIEEVEKKPAMQLGSVGAGTEASSWGGIKSMWH